MSPKRFRVDNPENLRREPKAKRPYNKPAVESFELFERRSLTCTQQPVNARTPSCGTFQSSVA